MTTLPKKKHPHNFHAIQLSRQLSDLSAQDIDNVLSNVNVNPEFKSLLTPLRAELIRLIDQRQQILQKKQELKNLQHNEDDALYDFVSPISDTDWKALFKGFQTRFQIYLDVPKNPKELTKMLLDNYFNGNRVRFFDSTIREWESQYKTKLLPHIHQMIDAKELGRTPDLDCDECNSPMTEKDEDWVCTQCSYRLEKSEICEEMFHYTYWRPKQN